MGRRGLMASWKNVQYKNGQYRTSEGSGGSSTLSGLDDVAISSASNGQVLKYNSTSSKWVNANDISVTALEDLTDVDVDTKSDGDVLTYNEAQDCWEAAEPLGGGIQQSGLSAIDVQSAIDELSQSTGVSTLGDLTDTAISSPSNNQVLTYDTTTSKWKNANATGGASTLNDLTDVDTTGVLDNNFLAYSQAQSKWVPATVSGGGNVDDVQVNGTSVVTNKVAQIKSYREVTQAEYEALPASKLSDNILYAIKDGGQAVEGFPPLIYSDQEREVGVWRDGKPLYQKTFFYPGPYSGNANHELPLLSGIEFVSFNILAGKNQDGLGIVIPYVNAATQYSVAVWILSDSSKMNLATYGGNTISNLVAVVNYTKVADQPGSGTWTTQGAIAHHYSTDEHIIGTWIDGKPIYEKCIPLSNLIGGDNTIQHNISNLEKVVSVGGYIISNDTQTCNPIPCPSQASGWNARIRDITSTIFIFELGSGIAAYYSSGVAIFQYTKTTD